MVLSFIIYYIVWSLITFASSLFIQFNSTDISILRAQVKSINLTIHTAVKVNKIVTPYYVTLAR